jgi:hypothetical protein
VHHFMNMEESLLWDKIWVSLKADLRENIHKMEVEFGKDTLGPCVYVRVKLNKGFAFEILDTLKRKIQRLVDVEQPDLVSYIRFL